MKHDDIYRGRDYDVPGGGDEEERQGKEDYGSAKWCRGLLEQCDLCADAVRALCSAVRERGGKGEILYRGQKQTCAGVDECVCMCVLVFVLRCVLSMMHSMICIIHTF